MPDVLHIRRAVAILGEDQASLDARLEAHRDTLPRAQGRRMNPLGLALDLALGDDAPAPDEPLVYVSRYGMSRTLEDYLVSFPHPSPLAFQNAIHPAGIEQYLVPRKAVIGELVPVAVDAETGMAPALRTLFLTPGGTRRLAGGEERGTWLAEREAAARSTFAFALTLAETAAPGDLGTLARTAFDGAVPTVSPLDFTRAIDARAPIRIAAPGFGVFTLGWA